MNSTDKKEIVMNRINSSSLFHFTRELDTLKLIIEKGLRYSFSVEDRPETVECNNCSKGKIIIPMICFCDVPLMRTPIHRETYGSYCIGFDKYFLVKKLGETLNPVSYYNSVKAKDALRTLYDFSDMKINEGLAELRNDPTLAFDINNNFLQGNRIQKSLKYILAYYKPCYKILETGLFKDYTDEREWRAILEENKKEGCIWKFNASGQLYYDNEKKEECTIAKKTASMCNEDICDNSSFFLRLTEDEIGESLTHILTNKEAEVPLMVDFIFSSISLFGCKSVSENLRKILVSKITSFERIEKDF